LAKLHAALGILSAKGARYEDARQEFQAAQKLAKQLMAARPEDREILYVLEVTAKLVAAIENCHNTCPQAVQYPTPFVLN